MPGRVFRALRASGTALLTPLFFSYATGHFRSSLRSAPVDRHGQPIPWYTYPAIEFLCDADYAGRTVWEWGAGHSTLWWARRCSTVTAVDDDAAWLDYIRARAPANVTLLDATHRVPSIAGLWDIIVIDGLDRATLISPSIDALTVDGALIVDNADGQWGEGYPIIEACWRAGLKRIDFYGFVAGGMVPECTSVFFRDTCFLLLRPQPPHREWTPHI